MFEPLQLRIRIRSNQNNTNKKHKIHNKTKDEIQRQNQIKRTKIQIKMAPGTDMMDWERDTRSTPTKYKQQT
jgi:hypothetical protein